MDIKMYMDTKYSLLQLVINVYIVPVVCIIGLVENILVIVILHRNKHCGKTTTFMVQMVAVADIFYLIMSLFTLTLDTIAKKTDVGREYIKPSVWPYFEPYIVPIASIIQTVTVWLVVLMTGDRFLGVCYPMKAIHYSTVSLMKKLTIVIWLISCLYNIPRFFERRVVTSQNYTKVEEWMSIDSNYIIVYQTTMFFIVRFVTPYALLCVFSIRILNAIKESFNFQNQLSMRFNLGNINTTTQSQVDVHNPTLTSKQQRQRATTNQATITLVTAVFIYLICEIPDKIYRLLTAVHHSTQGKRVALDFLMDWNVISKFLLAINSTTNFIVHCLMLKWFRHDLLALAGKKVVVKHDSESSKNGEISTEKRNSNAHSISVFPM